MKIVFSSFASTFRICTETHTCGKGTIRHRVGQYEKNGQVYIAYMCHRCFTTTVNTETNDEHVAVVGS